MSNTSGAQAALSLSLYPPTDWLQKHKPPLSIFQGLLLGRETELEQHYNQKEDEEEEHKPDHPDADGDVFLRRHHIDSAGKALQLKVIATHSPNFFNITTRSHG